MTQLQTVVPSVPKKTAIPVSSNLLERRCPCGGIPGPAGECAACRAKRLARESRRLSEPGRVQGVCPSRGRSCGHSLSAIRTHDTTREARARASEVAHVAQELFFLRAAEKATDAPDDTDREPEFLYQGANGETTCTLPGGTPTTTIFNAACSKPCTERHEGVHRADIATCCTAAGTAYAAAATAAAKSAVSSRFFGWMGANVPWFECRAYAESVTCADGMISAKHCGTPAMAPGDSACCTELTSYRADKEASRASNCASAAASLTACPFP